MFTSIRARPTDQVTLSMLFQVNLAKMLSTSIEAKNEMKTTRAPSTKFGTKKSARIDRKKTNFTQCPSSMSARLKPENSVKTPLTIS